MLEKILSVLFPVFAIIFIGYVAGRKNILDATRASKILSEFAFKFAIPALIFTAMSRTTFQDLFQFNYVASYIIALLLSAGVSTLILFSLNRLTVREIPICIMNGSVSNSIYVGLPIMMLAYNNALPVIIVVLIQVLGVTPLVLYYLEKQTVTHATGIITTWLRVLKTPVVFCSLLGIFSSILELNYPAPVDKTLEIIGYGGVPCALFALGLTLAAEGVFSTKEYAIDVYLIVFSKLILQPVAAFLVASYIIGLEDEYIWPLVIMAGMPSAINGYIFARQYNTYLVQSSAIVALSTLLSFFTLGAILAIAR